MAPEIITAIKKRLDQQICGYSQIFNPQYYQAFLNWTKSRYGWAFDIQHCVNSSGVVPALYDLIEYICKPDDKILIFTPSYGFFKHAADGHNIQLLTSDLICKDGYYSMDFKDVQTKLRDDKVSLCILCNPHNPTGRVWNEDELKQLGQMCLDNNVKIIADEIHCDLLRKGQVFTPLAKLFPKTDKIITCMAPSKSFNLAGFMFANIIIPNDELRTKWHEKHLPMANPLSIAAAQAAYTDGQAWLSELTSYLDTNFEYLRDFLLEHLPKATYKIPESTYLAWINISAYFPDGENLTMLFAQKAGVLLEGGNMFVANAEGYIRLNLALPRSRLKEGLKRIATAINNE
ncbi:MAG: aminotransferase class I/II-fold pyridoxal phosphate-dependent enzyme [Alcanivoracaceae bacterium]|nr:aminotransferase class I/II-fold pyridoxal phosphate-dependent enzyme [Alcanivoracaceae bacterium]